MKATTPVGVALMLVLGAVSASAQDGRLNDEAVQAALDIGAADDDDDFKDLFAACTANPGFRESLGALVAGAKVTHTGSYRVTFTSHHGLIAMAAAERKAKYMDLLPPSEISDELRIPVLRLWLEPQADSGARRTVDLAASINHVVIRPHGRDEEVVQPLSFETEPVVFSNLLGAQFTSMRALVTFPSDRALEVVVITSAGERKCNVDNDDIDRMFQMDRGSRRFTDNERDHPESSLVTREETERGGVSFTLTSGVEAIERVLADGDVRLFGEGRLG